MNTIIEILIDRSGSMGFMKGTTSENKYLLPDGSTRMSVIKKILLADIFPTIEYATKIVIRTFRLATKNEEDIDEIELFYKGDYVKDDLVEKINGLDDPPSGGTPITAAIEDAVENLKTYSNYDRSIILLTDGEENGGGNYLQAIEKAKNLEGIPCRIFIVGINQDDEAAEISKAITANSKGTHINVTTKDYSTDSISSALVGLKTAILSSSMDNITSIQSPTVSESDFSCVNHSETNAVDEQDSPGDRKDINAEAKEDNDF